MNGESKYQSQEDLEPLVNAPLEWKVMLADIRSNNWNSQYDACSTLRRVCKFHLKEILYGENKKGNLTEISKDKAEEFKEIIRLVKYFFQNF
jgi:hypothetical protein